MIAFAIIFCFIGNHRGSDKKLNRAIPKEKHAFLRNLNEWRNAILAAFGYDPLKCPECSSTMLFLELYFNHKRVSLEDLYERAVSKARGKRSPA